jgi:hypothetical protein
VAPKRANGIAPFSAATSAAAVGIRRGRLEMRELKYFVACTVDGFIAAEDGSIDAFVDDRDYFAELFESFPETCPGHLREALEVRGPNKHFDAVLMGRNTYEPGLELEEARKSAQRELEGIKHHQERIEELERDKEALLDHYEGVAPGALDSLTSEERYRFYKLVQLQVCVSIRDTVWRSAGPVGSASVFVKTKRYR